MIRHTAPYGAGPTSFAAGIAGGAVPFGAPAPPAGLNLPFAVSNGPTGAGALPSLNTPFSVGGFYNSSATQGWPTNTTVPHHYIAMQNQKDDRSRGRLADLSEVRNFFSKTVYHKITRACARVHSQGMIVFARNPTAVPAKAGGVSQRFDVPESANTVELLELNQLNDKLAKGIVSEYANAEVRNSFIILIILNFYFVSIC